MPALAITRYESSTGPYSTEAIDSPSWEQLRSSILDLDQDLSPFIWFYLSSESDLDNDIPDFDVTGGNGLYFIHLKDGDRELMFSDPSLGDDDVDVWLSDQGASFPARNVCRDVETVLSIAKRYYDHGDALEGISWEAY